MYIHENLLKNNKHWIEKMQTLYNKNKNLEFKLLFIIDNEDIRMKIEKELIYKCPKEILLNSQHNEEHVSKMLGFKHSEESKDIMNKNSARYWKGKSFSEEHIRKLSESRLGNKNPFYGKTHSKEKLKQISDSLKNSEKIKKLIERKSHKISTPYVNFPSVNEASRVLNLTPYKIRKNIENLEEGWIYLDKKVNRSHLKHLWIDDSKG